LRKGEAVITDSCRQRDTPTNLRSAPEGLRGQRFVEIAAAILVTKWTDMLRANSYAVAIKFTDDNWARIEIAEMYPSAADLDQGPMTNTPQP